MAVAFNGKHLAKFIRPEEYEAIYPQVELAHKQLETKTGFGNDFLGWLDLPVTYDKEEFARIKEAAQKIRSDSDVLLVAGIGGFLSGCPCCSGGRQGPVPQRDFRRPEDLLLRQHDLAHRPERHHQAHQGQAFLHQCHLQVRYDYRDRAGFFASCASCWRIPLVLRKPTSAFTPRPTVPKAPSSSWLLSRAGPPSSFPMTSAAATLS